ncbi:MAG TPA: hypothetical protein VD836_17160, partial [Solirubrobacteraceae bacterium]|nr:hypothetical protein [Solirubrobacteraceae bacterium]
EVPLDLVAVALPVLAGELRRSDVLAHVAERTRPARCAAIAAHRRVRRRRVRADARENVDRARSAASLSTLMPP